MKTEVFEFLFHFVVVLFSYRCFDRSDDHRNDTSPNLDGVGRYNCAPNSNYSFDGSNYVAVNDVRANSNSDTATSYIVVVNH